MREGAIRLSPHAYNTLDEMERVVEVLEESRHDIDQGFPSRIQRHAGRGVRN